MANALHLCFLLLAFAVATQAAKCPIAEEPSKHIVCYYEETAKLEDVNFCNCTHLIFTNISTLSEDYSLIFNDDVKQLEHTALSAKNVSLVFSVQLRPDQTSAVFKSTKKKIELVNSISKFLKTSQFSGVELDFEFALEDGSRKEGLVSFVKDLRNLLDHHRVKRDGYSVFEDQSSDFTTNRYSTEKYQAKSSTAKKSVQKRKKAGRISREDKNVDFYDEEGSDSSVEEEEDEELTVKRSIRRREGDQEDAGVERLIFLRLSVVPEIIGKKYDLKELSSYVDYMIASTQMITDPSENGVTFHPSRLMGLSDMLNTDSVLDLLTGLGAPKSILIIALPAFVVKHELKNPDENTARSPTVGSFKKISQSKMCAMLKKGNWTVERDEDLTAPYAFSKTTWLAFEDEISSDIKGKYIILRDLAGAAVVSVDDDSTSETCSWTKGGRIAASLHNNFQGMARKPRQVVLESLQEQIHDTSFYSEEAGVHLSEYRIVRVVDHSGAVHVIRKNTKTEFECSRQGYFSHPLGCNKFYRCVKFNQYTDDFTVFEYDCPAGLAFDERWEVCVWPGSLPNGAPCTGSSEIAPVPRSYYQCPNVEGYYADPENCRWFFACLDHAGDGVTPLTAYEFRCPFGLVFDEGKLACDWPWIVGACGARGAAGVVVAHAGGASAYLGTASTLSAGNYIGGPLVDNQNRASFATVPDYVISGGRIPNNGGVILNHNIVGAPLGVSVSTASPIVGTGFVGRPDGAETVIIDDGGSSHRSHGGAAFNRNPPVLSGIGLVGGIAPTGDAVVVDDGGSSHRSHGGAAFNRNPPVLSGIGLVGGIVPTGDAVAVDDGGSSHRSQGGAAFNRIPPVLSGVGLVGQVTPSSVIIDDGGSSHRSNGGSAFSRVPSDGSVLIADDGGSRHRSQGGSAFSRVPGLIDQVSPLGSSVVITDDGGAHARDNVVYAVHSTTPRPIVYEQQGGLGTGREIVGLNAGVVAVPQNVNVTPRPAEFIKTGFYDEQAVIEPLTGLNEGGYGQKISGGYVYEKPTVKLELPSKNAYLPPAAPAIPVVTPKPVVYQKPAVSLQPVFYQKQYTPQPIILQQSVQTPRPIVYHQEVVTPKPIIYQQALTPVVSPKPVIYEQNVLQSIRTPKPYIYQQGLVQTVAATPIISRPVVTPRPIVYQQEIARPVITPRPIVYTQQVVTPKPVVYQQEIVQPVVTPRPVVYTQQFVTPKPVVHQEEIVVTPKTVLYQQEIVQPVVTPRPVMYTQQVVSPKTVVYQQEVVQPVVTPKPVVYTQQIVTPKPVVYQQEIVQPVVTPRPVVYTQQVVTPKPVVYQQEIAQPVVTPRPVVYTQQVVTAKPVAYQQEIVQPVVTPRPVVYTQQVVTPKPVVYQQEIVQPVVTPRPVVYTQQVVTPKPVVYQQEIVQSVVTPRPVVYTQQAVTPKPVVYQQEIVQPVVTPRPVVYTQQIVTPKPVVYHQEIAQPVITPKPVLYTQQIVTPKPVVYRQEFVQPIVTPRPVVYSQQVVTSKPVVYQQNIVQPVVQQYATPKPVAQQVLQPVLTQQVYQQEYVKPLKIRRPSITLKPIFYQQPLVTPKPVVYNQEFIQHAVTPVVYKQDFVTPKPVVYQEEIQPVVTKQVVTPNPVVYRQEVVTPKPIVYSPPTLYQQEIIQPVVTPKPVVYTQQVVTPKPIVYQQEMVQSVVTPKPVVYQQEIVQPVVSTKPVAFTQRIVTPKPVLYQQEIVTPKPVVYQQEVVTPKPILYQQNFIAPKQVVYQQEIVTPKPVVYQQEIVTPKPVVYAQKIVTPKPVVYQEQYVRPVVYNQQIVTPRPVIPIYQTTTPKTAVYQEIFNVPQPPPKTYLPARPAIKQRVFAPTPVIVQEQTPVIIPRERPRPSVIYQEEYVASNLEVPTPRPVVYQQEYIPVTRRPIKKIQPVSYAKPVFYESALVTQRPVIYTSTTPSSLFVDQTPSVISVKQGFAIKQKTQSILPSPIVVQDVPNIIIPNIQTTPQTVYAETFERVNPGVAVLQKEVLPVQFTTTERPIVTGVIKETKLFAGEEYLPPVSVNYELQKVRRPGVTTVRTENYGINSNIDIAPPSEEYLLNIPTSTTESPATYTIKSRTRVRPTTTVSTLEYVEPTSSRRGKSRGKATIVSIGQVDKAEVDDQNIDVVLDKYSGKFGELSDDDKDKFVTKVIKGNQRGQIKIGKEPEISTVGYEITSVRGRSRVRGGARKFTSTSTSTTEAYEEDDNEDEDDDKDTDTGDVSLATLDLKNLKLKKDKKTVIVVSQVSDANPILIGKLAGQCSCESNKVNLRKDSRPSGRRGGSRKTSTDDQPREENDGNDGEETSEPTRNVPRSRSGKSRRPSVPENDVDAPTVIIGDQPISYRRQPSRNGNGVENNAFTDNSDYPSRRRYPGGKGGSRASIIDPDEFGTGGQQPTFLDNIAVKGQFGTPGQVNVEILDNDDQPLGLTSTTTILPEVSPSILVPIAPSSRRITTTTTTEIGVLLPKKASGPRRIPSRSKAREPFTPDVKPLFTPITADEIASTTGYSKDGSDGSNDIGPRDSGVKSKVIAGAAFDRYGPGGLRSADETLQGSVDCKRPGLFRHPKYCNKFYACNYDKHKKRYTLHVFNCPVHLAYDSNIGACNWPSKGPACADDNLLV